MRSDADVRRVFELWDQGLSKNKISQATGVSRERIRSWLAMGLDGVLASPRRVGASRAGPCEGACKSWLDVDMRAYAYLFGQYLGDGNISEMRRFVFRLRITMCDDYPDIRAETERAMQIVMPGRSVGGQPRIGCTDVYGYSKHWPCLFPQHGPGRKHERPMILRRWQENIVFDRYPHLFLRGLVHSDGCRSLNWTTHHKTRERLIYPRYLFTNESGHILGFFREACRRLGVECRYSKRNTLSVAKRASVATLDAFIGPKS